MKNFIIGFFSCFILGLLVAIAPIRSNYKDFNDVTVEFQNLYRYAQPKQFEILDSTPNFNALMEGEIRLINSNSVLSAVTRYQSSTYTFIWSKL